MNQEDTAARVSTYLNFKGNAEEAFDFYRTVFGTDYLAGHVIMATDMLESMNHELSIGNNTTINLEPDTLEETHRLFDALSEGSSQCAPLAKMFWGATWGTCLDRFGLRWMFNFVPVAD